METNQKYKSTIRPSKSNGHLVDEAKDEQEDATTLAAKDDSLGSAVPTMRLSDVLNVQSPTLEKIKQKLETSITQNQSIESETLQRQRSNDSSETTQRKPDPQADLSSSSSVLQQNFGSIHHRSISSSAFQEVFRLVLVLLGLAYALTCMSLVICFIISIGML